ncbi:GNAT family N-acetyltransferase [Dactylosporangium siamense]|uniref:GNAT family N-acetyltransferase n=1 Tax=Dactylosporangium siamense TaxID=685454 RepID=A0A919PLI1_9ACTN|nr:bifunctional GNAT family N-acetyltransferase/acetate--CoA ligase family protein [Dactylosporangium siamense]GIG44253.1 GNAT family N-acetyltransferase [Dactylosporangium siamense]
MTETPDRAADVLLSDGTTVHLRPIRPDDADRIVALHSRFSERTRYLRYFSAYPRIPQRDLDRFVTVDHRDREAFVIEHGGELIAVGRYERLGAGSHQAEVAFVVEDAHQGRGIGSVLIEHLVAAASQEGITEFEADVLPVNQAMLRVFMAAGFQIERKFSDGVVHLWFPIAATPDSMRVQWSREQQAEARSIGRLLNPRGVAVYGARADGTGIGAAILAHLKAAGPAGPLIPVHPSAAGIGGLPAVAALAGTTHPVDLAVVAVPADAVLSVAEDCAAAGVHGLVVVSAGFAEAGPAGAEAQATLLRTVRSHGMRLVGPNCLGIANTDPGVQLNATLAPLLPRRGRVGFFSQSAALGTALLAEADRRGLGLSTFVSAGNRADVSGNDALQYWRDDPHTDAVLLYLETFGNPRKFARIARELARRKPVAAVASPVRTPLVSTGLPSGPDARGVAALFASSGVIRVDTVAELFDVGLLIAGQPLPTGDRIAVVTNAAALGVLTVAKAPAAGLRVASVRDLGPEVSDADFVRAVREALADDAVDAVLAAYAPALAISGDLGVAELLRTSAVESARPLAVVLPADPSFTVAPAYVESDPTALPTYPAIEEAVRALGRVARYAAWRREPVGTVPTFPAVAADLAGDIDGLLAAYGVPVVPSRRTSGPDVATVAAALGLPVALKVATKPWRHRLDLGAVRLNLTSPALVDEAYQELERLFGLGVEVLVQPMVAPGVACVVEVVDDPAFGPVVGFGLGGEAADLLGDRAWRPVPLTDRDAAALVRAPRAAPLLTGYRGSAPVDLDALADLLLRVGRLVDDQPTLSSLSLNPILARPEGLAVLHATADFTTPLPRPDSGPRRLF